KRSRFQRGSRRGSASLSGFITTTRSNRVAAPVKNFSGRHAHENPGPARPQLAMPETRRLKGFRGRGRLPGLLWRNRLEKRITSRPATHELRALRIQVLDENWKLVETIANGNFKLVAVRRG